MECSANESKVERFVHALTVANQQDLVVRSWARSVVRLRNAAVGCNAEESKAGRFVCEDKPTAFHYIRVKFFRFTKRLNIKTCKIIRHPSVRS